MRNGMDVNRMLKIKTPENALYDLVSLGEVMLRLDPGETRISHASSFRVWEGGGEYNVAKALGSCFRMRTAIVTAVADNPVGALLLGQMRRGGVDTQYVQLDTSEDARIGLNFTERGFGPRGAIGVSDRANSAAARMKPGDVDWDALFGERGVRWFHTGGIFSALSDATAELVIEAVQAAHKYGTVVSYDLNYRPSLWNGHGGQEKAITVNRAVLPYVDVLFGNETDYFNALGFGDGTAISGASGFEACAEEVHERFSNISVLATSLRTVHSATKNDWSGAVWAQGHLYAGQVMHHLEILDRVGGGDGFASGLIYGLLGAQSMERALAYGIAHGALVMSTPGDTSMATVEEVIRLADGGSMGIIR